MNTYKLFFQPLALVLVFTLSLSAQSENVDPKEAEIETLNAFMDAWHLAAAEANTEEFFGSMREDAIYIGTDKTERWLRDDLRKWAANAFERESAWIFKASERNWQLKLDKQFAICDELLDTWMGPCRATAVLTWEKDGWKIIHYQLSVTIDNEKINDFKALQEAH
tara:strand:+ start:5979 stop:6476 length:498 start_codon:yes stop_codon:yes gene_type:complete